MGLVQKAAPRREFLPHEAGEWMDFGRVTYGDRKEARDRHTDEVMRKAQDWGEVMRNLPQSAPGAKRPTLAPDQEYDLIYLLSRVIRAWSYDVPVTEEAIRDLDARTFDWAVGIACEELAPVGEA